jgi:hypothetical protein
MGKGNPGEVPMQKTTVLRAGQLAPATRAWLASVLHTELEDSDDLEVTLRRAVQVRSPAEREAARRQLGNVLAAVDARTRDLPEPQIEAAVNEAIQQARSPSNE